MKNVLLACTLLISSLVFISWGVTGHRSIGIIAANHLTPKARTAVIGLLGNDSLANVANWADEVRNEPEYKATAPWHFLNLPLGLSYDDFEKMVKGMGPDNVYGAVLKCESDLTDTSKTQVQKIAALKFIVHFVGDLHQPMHIRRAEDKGGNTMRLTYEGKATNLHSLWDTKLIEHQGLDYMQLAEKYDRISAKQIKKWQSDSLLTWIWESYQLSSKLYAENDSMKSPDIDDAYYQAHIGIIQERIEQAGIRLAGLLNGVYAQN
jgi:hypothetical protein